MTSRIIPNFPSPYEGELFYHTIARAMAQMSAMPVSHKKLLLFGRIYGVKFYIPDNIGFLSNRLGGLLNPLDVIQNHSIFPFYNLFLFENYQNKFLGHVINPSLPNNLRLKIPGNLSLSTMRYCPTCLKKQMENKLPLYPRVEWQLPGIDICPFDYTYLKDYPLNEGESIFKNYLVMDESRLSFDSSACLDSHFVKLAQMALELLSVPLGASDKKNLRLKIHALLQKTDYYTNHYFDYKRFSFDLHRLYSSEVLNKVEIVTADRWKFGYNFFNDDWIYHILTNNSNHFPNPVGWLMIINFLNVSLDEFLNTNISGVKCLAPVDFII